MLGLSAAAWAQTNYRDPKGRFTLRVPVGWNTTPVNADAVSFGRGNAFATVMVFTGNTDPPGILKGITQTFGMQWKNFVEARRGDTKFAGRTGPYITFSGVNPKGLDSYLQLLAVTDGGSSFVLICTAPKTEYTKARPMFDQIEQSFALGTPKASAFGPPVTR
jgi:hypothetical protein